MAVTGLPGRGGERRQLGAHTSIAGGFHRALVRGAESGCQVIQIFCKSNQQWRSRPISDAELELWQRARSRLEVIPALVHASYLINLASSSGDIAERSVRGLLEELARTARLGIPYLVLHPGAHGGPGEAQGIARVARALDRVVEQHGAALPRILLENTAGQGHGLGYRFEHLRDILGASRHRLLNEPRFSAQPMVIETPKPVAALDRANLALLRSLIHTARVGRTARRCLAELREPAAACGGGGE